MSNYEKMTKYWRVTVNSFIFVEYFHGFRLYHHNTKLRAQYKVYATRRRYIW